MQNILIGALGTAGEVLPFIGIGGELRKRGHDVTFISNPYFEPSAREMGLSFSPVGTLEYFQKFMTDSTIFHWKTAEAPERAMVHFVHVVEGAYAATMKLHRPGRTVLFAGAGFLLGAQIAQERSGIPLVMGLVSPSRLRSRYDPSYPPRPLPAWAARLAQTRTGLRFLYLLIGARNKLSGLRRSAAPIPPANPIRDEVNRVRANLELPEIGGYSGVRPPRPQRVICMWPDWFADRQKDWPVEAVVTGFPFHPPSGGEPESVPGRSVGTTGSEPLVFTTGSIACQQQAFFAAAVETCRILKRPGLLVTPHADQVPRPLPPEVTHVTHAPFGDLFARSALVVHHGGVGTIALALAAGVPQIARPMMGEQFDLGNRMQRLSVGRMIAGPTMSAAQLAGVIDSLLKSERVSKACRHWQARIDRRAGLTLAADSIENLAG